MLLVLLLNLVQNAEKASEYMWNFWIQIRVVFAAEVRAPSRLYLLISRFPVLASPRPSLFVPSCPQQVVADWVKHAFISKFNGLDSGLYSRFTLVLVHDVTEARHDSSRPLLDHTHSLARRIGLAQLPLAAIAARFLQVVWARAVPFFAISASAQRELLCYGFACLLAAKVLTGILLAGVFAECRIEEETAKAERRQKEAAKEPPKEPNTRTYSMSKWWA